MSRFRDELPAENPILLRSQQPVRGHIRRAEEGRTAKNMFEVKTSASAPSNFSPLK